MKRLRDITMRLLPMLAVVAVIVGLSEWMYQSMIRREIEQCWDEMEMAAHDVTKEMNIRFADNMKMLDLAADAISMDTHPNWEKSLLDHVATLCSETIYERIDVLLPSGEILLQSGEWVAYEDRTSYDELLARSPFLSTRTTDQATGREVLYYFTPIITDGVTQGLLVGTIDCQTMGELFYSEHYAETSQIFMADLRDGKLLIDRYHPSLGNIEDLKQHPVTEEFAGIDFVADAMEGNTGHVAFISQDSGEVLYVSYMTVEEQPFTVALLIPEKVIFAEVEDLRSLLAIVGAVESLVLAAYLVWYAVTTARMASNREKIRMAQMEQEKNDAKSRFLSSISHDIRTPLNGIIGMLDVIRLRGEIPEHMTESLHKIDVSAKYLLTLASDVLDMNELEAGKIVLANDPVNLTELISDLEIIMKPRANAKGVDYYVDCSGLKNPHVLGSGVHISKILSNIIGNAIKYNRENGQVFITAEDSFRSDGLRDYRFTVRDTGIGITGEFQKNMFSAFEQENTGARTANMGHGLGLSIVKRLVDQMQGTIAVESEKNVGTTFVVTLPLSRNLDWEEPAAPAQKLENLSGVNLLVVEDNELNMEIANVILTQAGAQVTCAVNGQVAVEHFAASEQYHFDAILMDIMMPVMDGHEATRTIRAMDRPDAKRIPIIAMTASTFSEDIQHCKESGMSGHVGKPLDMNSLMIKAAKQIGTYRSQR